ncbi:hypothetical protein [Roseateles sp.]
MSWAAQVEGSVPGRVCSDRARSVVELVRCDVDDQAVPVQPRL